MRWKRLIFIAALELATLGWQFGLPALQGRVFGDARFPHLIIFTVVSPAQT
jgi:hypothetical protein